MNNNMEKNYKSGQIFYVKSSLGSWHYICVLRNAKPTKHTDETYELHTCCDLCIDPNSSDDLTFERGNGSFLDLDISFKEVREATDAEREYLYRALVKAFKDHDLGWANHFTDSSYFDILDWLAWEFNVDLDSEFVQKTPLGETISEIQNYIWDSLCRETGNHHACTDYAEPEMVNKQEFIEKVVEWVKNRDNTEKYLHIRTSLIDNFAEALRKYLEE